LALSVFTPLSKVFNGISDHTIFKNDVIPFQDRLDNLPGDSIKLFGFETILGRNLKARNPDMALCFSKKDFGILADWCDSFSSHSCIGSYWAGIKNITQGKSHSLPEHLNALWIEMDRTESSRSDFQSPGLFLELLEGNINPEFACRQIIPILTGNHNHPSRAQVERCLSLIPDTGELAHFGYFPSRSTEKLRMTISFNHYHDMISYCSTLFGKRVNREILTRIEKLSAFSDFAVLHLDIGSDIEERLGIEMRFRENEQNPEYQWRWRDLLTNLIDRGLCSSEEAEELLGFSGITRYINESTFSPSWYKYFLYYIKGVFDFSGREYYKAYCAFRQLSPF